MEVETAGDEGGREGLDGNQMQVVQVPTLKFTKGHGSRKHRLPLQGC